MALINTTTTGVLGSTFYGDGTGSLTVQQNGVTLGTYGNIPAFSAYQTNGSANQSISSDSWTKAKIDTKEFDTNNNFDTTTYRFTPTVAGYYQLNGCLYLRNAAASALKISGIYKNGSIYKVGISIYFTGNYYIAADNLTVSTLMYLNGTTDYTELYGYINSSSASIGYGSTNSWFNGYLVKAA
jgi:hypothetical protein